MTRAENSSPKVASSLATYLRSIVRDPREGLYPILGIATTYLASRHLGAWAGAVVSGFWVAVVGLSWSRLVAELDASIEHYAGLALLDDLTGLGNDRSFRSALRMGLTGADSRGPSLTLALADVDRFKSFNDSFGHPAGDVALEDFGRILVANAGESASVYRLGGDEFAVLLRGLDAASSLEIAERMKAAVESHAWPGRAITASMGLATIDRAGREVDEPSTFLGRADRALYRAKRDGGNTIVLGSAEDASPA